MKFKNCHYTIAREPKEGQLTQVAGWGRTRRRPSENTKSYLLRHKVNVKELQVLIVPIANQECTDSNSRIKIDTTRQICAGGERGLYNIITCQNK